MKPRFRSRALAGFWFAATSLVALQAGAQSAAEFDRNGPYLMAGGGYSFENFDINPLSFDFKDDDLDVTFPTHFDDSPNVIVHAGWRFHPHAAVDIGFEWNTGFDGSFGGMDADLETYLTTIGLKIYALKGRIQPFLHPSIGVMVLERDADIPPVPPLDPDDPDPPLISGGLPDKTTPALRAGGGVDIYVTENLFVSISAYYVLPLDSDVKGAQYVPVSAAVGWRF